MSVYFFLGKSFAEIRVGLDASDLPADDLHDIGLDPVVVLVDNFPHVILAVFSDE